MSQPETTTLALDDSANVRAARIESIVERLGWALGATVLLAALLGYLGPGPLAARQRRTPDGGVAATYFAVARYEGPTELDVWFWPRPGEDRARLAVSRSFADDITAESITPQPAAVEIRGDKTVYTFRASGVETGSHLRFRFKHNEYGWRTFRLGLEGRDEVEVTQLVLP